MGPLDRPPDDVEITDVAPAPIDHATLGIDVDVDRIGEPAHRLVAIGDSITHGVQSGAVFHTDLSYPAIIAHELGWGAEFRHPTYPGFGGLPLNMEWLVRDLEARLGPGFRGWRYLGALRRSRRFMGLVEDYWERGPGAEPPPLDEIHHNLAVYGWDLNDVMHVDADQLRARISPPRNHWLAQSVEDDNERAALRVLDSARRDGRALTPIGAAEALGADGLVDGGDGPGIETLVILLGPNNALSVVTDLRVEWSTDRAFDDPDQKHRFTAWRPRHFAVELDRLVALVRRIRARHVVWGTVPHVTILPIARGVGGKVEPGSRYFQSYTRPWAQVGATGSGRGRSITSDEACAVDSAIDQYNQAIVGAVRAARREGRNWYVADLTSLLDRIAVRRYISDREARPEWWEEYVLPDALQGLEPVPNTQWYSADRRGRHQGGLFSLDGVHPSTVGYGLVAQQFIDVMVQAGVEFRTPAGATRTGPIHVDFDRLVGRDPLLSDPPRAFDAGMEMLAWADRNLGPLRRHVPVIGGL